MRQSREGARALKLPVVPLFVLYLTSPPFGKQVPIYFFNETDEIRALSRLPSLPRRSCGQQIRQSMDAAGVSVCTYLGTLPTLSSGNGD